MKLETVLQSKLTFPLLVIGTVVVIIAGVVIVWMSSTVTSENPSKPVETSGPKSPL